MPLGFYATQYLDTLEDYWEINGKYPDVLKPKYFENGEFRKALNSRGLPLPEGLAPTAVGITPVQRAVIKAIANYADRTPTKKKLDQFGVTMNEYKKWLVNPEFASRLGKAVDSAFIREASLEAKIGLARLISEADLPSIKYFHELTGEYRPAETQVANLTVLLGRLMEILVTYLDPAILPEIADQLEKAVLDVSSKELTR